MSSHLRCIISASQSIFELYLIQPEKLFATKAASMTTHNRSRSFKFKSYDITKAILPKSKFPIDAMTYQHFRLIKRIVTVIMLENLYKF